MIRTNGGKLNTAINVRISLLMLLSAVAVMLFCLPADAKEEFSKSAWDVVNDVTVGWNLGNDLDCYDDTGFGSSDLSAEGLWGNPAASRELIAAVKASGINTVRLPVTWYNHMDPQTYEIDPLWMQRVREVVDEILDEEMYCILNVHHDTGVKGWLTADQSDLEHKEEIFTIIWEQNCDEFGDYGDRLIFEGYNEILNEEQVWDTPDEETFAVANELNQKFVNIVRGSGKNNTKRILYVKTYCSSCHEASLEGFIMPEDTVDGRIIAGVHIYKPFNFTHEDYPDETTWTESEIDKAMEDVHERFVANGIPVLIGEFGCAYKNNDEERISWANYFMRTAADNGLKACWWDEGDLYKLFNRYVGTVSEPELLQAILTGAEGIVYTPGSAVDRKINRLRERMSVFIHSAAEEDSVKAWIPFAAGTLGCIVLVILLALLYEGRRKKRYPTYDDLFDGSQPLVYRLWSRLLIVISAFFTFMYLLWRVLYSVPVEYGWVAIAANVTLLIIEIIGFLETLVHYTNILGTREHPLPAIGEEEYPEVDIFIATYNEPTDLLELTINGCRHLQYPDLSKVHIWVCDDNRRPEMRALADAMGVGYFDRPDNQGAKAGNLNHAMGLTSAPYVVTLDADMIVKSDFLLKTIPYFVDAGKRAAASGKEGIKLGFIQTPQCFYDPDVFQFALYSEHRAPNEQNFFYQTIEPARTSTNSVIYGGSNTILSREALESIGGFYTGSITEDFATGLLIESAGYVSLGLPEPLASGRTPHTFKEHITQRIRWGRGVIVTARKLKLWGRKGLSFYQKLSYWGSVTYWYSPIKNLIYALSPLFYALFGIIVFRCTTADILLYWLPAFALQNICLRIMSHQAVSSKWSGIYETSVMPHMLIPIIKESLGITLSRFLVTDKTGTKTKKDRDVRSMVPFLILILFSLLGILRICVGVQENNLLNALIILFWLIRNMYFYIMALFLIDGRDGDGEPVKVIDAELVVLKSKQSTDAYEGITSRMNQHSITVYLDRANLRIGDFVEVSVSGETAAAKVSGVVIGCRSLRNSESEIVTVEIIDFGEDRMEYMQILFDRIPSLPQSLTLRDYGIVSHMWHNIVVRLAK